MLLQFLFVDFLWLCSERMVRAFPEITISNHDKYNQNRIYKEEAIKSAEVFIECPRHHVIMSERFKIPALCNYVRSIHRIW